MLFNKLDMNTEDFLHYDLMMSKKIYKRDEEVDKFINENKDELNPELIFRFQKIEEIIEETEREMFSLKSTIEKSYIRKEMLERLNKQYTTEYIKLENDINTNDRVLDVKLIEFEELKDMLFEIVREFNINEDEQEDSLVYFE